MTKRFVVLDSETNSLSPNQGYGIVDLGMVEVIGGVVVREYQQYINQPNKMSPKAEAIHGISDDFLKDKPKFEDVYKEILAFIGDSVIIAHNLAFDLRFLNAELERVGQPPLTNTLIDTLKVARGKYGKTGNTLDDLCTRFKIRNGDRDKAHSALDDARVLTNVCKHLLDDFNKTKEGVIIMAEQLENDQGLLEEGEYEARLVYVADLGLQSGYKDPKTGAQGESRTQRALCFEVIGKTRVYNNETLPKLIWGQSFNYFGKLTELGNEYKIIKIFDPKAEIGKPADWTGQLGKVCSITIEHYVRGDNTYDNITIGGITPIPLKYQKDIAEAVTKDMVFSEDCDEENGAQEAMFGLPQYIWENRLARDKDQPTTGDSQKGGSALVEDDDVPF